MESFINSAIVFDVERLRTASYPISDSFQSNNPWILIIMSFDWWTKCFRVKLQNLISYFAVINENKFESKRMSTPITPTSFVQTAYNTMLSEWTRYYLRILMPSVNYKPENTFNFYKSSFYFQRPLLYSETVYLWDGHHMPNSIMW